MTATTWSRRRYQSRRKRMSGSFPTVRRGLDAGARSRPCACEDAQGARDNVRVWSTGRGRQSQCRGRCLMGLTATLSRIRLLIPSLLLERVRRSFKGRSRGDLAPPPDPAGAERRARAWSAPSAGRRLGERASVPRLHRGALASGRMCWLGTWSHRVRGVSSRRRAVALRVRRERGRLPWPPGSAPGSAREDYDAIQTAASESLRTFSFTMLSRSARAASALCGSPSRRPRLVSRADPTHLSKPQWKVLEVHPPQLRGHRGWLLPAPFSPTWTSWRSSRQDAALNWPCSWRRRPRSTRR